MELSKEDQVLKEIIDKDGNCFEPEKLCRSCPFREPCLLSHLTSSLTDEERVGLALDRLARTILLEDEDG